jgi:hypothetical protein
LPFSTATPLLAYLLLRSQAKSVRGKGKHVPHLICATKSLMGERVRQYSGLQPYGPIRLLILP